MERDAAENPDGAADVVHARILRFLPELVRDLGGDPDALKAAGIAPGDTPTYRRAVIVLERLSERLGCPDLGMRLAMRQGVGGMFGPLGAVMGVSATFRDAIQFVCGHAYAHSLAARIWMEPHGGGALFVGHDLLIEGAPVRAQAMEQILLLGHLSAQQLTGGLARVRRVHFRHQPVSPPRVYRSRFGCDVRFGENDYGVFYAARDLRAPILAADPDRFRHAARDVEAAFPRQRPPHHLQVRGILMQRLASGGTSAEAVAGALGLHMRTMHRRLREERTSFQAVKDEVRREMLLYYLEHSRMDLSAISARLGFSEQSVMTRQCRRWTGDSPTQVRAMLRGTRALS